MQELSIYLLLKRNFQILRNQTLFKKFALLRKKITFAKVIIVEVPEMLAF